jgi:hypothetical protein
MAITIAASPNCARYSRTGFGMGSIMEVDAYPVIHYRGDEPLRCDQMQEIGRKALRAQPPCCSGILDDCHVRRWNRNGERAGVLIRQSIASVHGKSPARSGIAETLRAAGANLRILQDCLAR